MALSVTSRLDAVNTILSACGESPVSSLTEASADVSNACFVLDNVTREVQSLGWSFNRDENVPLAPNGDGEIILPANIIQVDVDVSDTRVDVVQRGSRLYDRISRSYQFKRPLRASTVTLLEFEQLPEAARNYIAIRAARRFHDRFVGDAQVHQFTAQDELEARTILRVTESRNADHNIFRSNTRYAIRCHRQ